MNKITLVYSYFDNPNMLKRHQEEWSKYANKEQFEIIIVDDCSINSPAMEKLYDTGIKTRLFYVKTQIPWNQDGARNLAMKHAEGWCLLLDMDMLLPKEEAEILLTYDLHPEVIYKNVRRSIKNNSISCHSNTYLITSKTFWDFGGYDEHFSGYYGSDYAFKKRLRRFYGELKSSPILLHALNGIISDATTKSLGRKNTNYDIRKNKLMMARLFLAPKPKFHIRFEWIEVVLKFNEN